MRDHIEKHDDIISTAEEDIVCYNEDIILTCTTLFLIHRDLLSYLDACQRVLPVASTELKTRT